MNWVLLSVIWYFGIQYKMTLTFRSRGSMCRAIELDGCRALFCFEQSFIIKTWKRLLATDLRSEPEFPFLQITKVHMLENAVGYAVAYYRDCYWFIWNCSPLHTCHLPCVTSSTTRAWSPTGIFPQEGYSTWVVEVIDGWFVEMLERPSALLYLMALSVRVTASYISNMVSEVVQMWKALVLSKSLARSEINCSWVIWCLAMFPPAPEAV